jgi:hypothetical protein
MCLQLPLEALLCCVAAMPSRLSDSCENKPGEWLPLVMYTWLAFPTITTNSNKGKLECAACRAVQFFTPGVPMVYYVVSKHPTP